MLTATLKKTADQVAAIRDRLGFLGPTLARLTLASVFIGTGWGKLNNLGSTIEYFTSLHIPAPAFNARLAAGTEFVGGVLLLLGLFTRLAALWERWRLRQHLPAGLPKPALRPQTQAAGPATDR